MPKLDCCLASWPLTRAASGWRAPGQGSEQDKEGVQGHRGDLSPSPLDSSRNTDHVSQMMRPNGQTDH
eukprot:10266712-Heterocapsa_arctica.AAC.1